MTAAEGWRLLADALAARQIPPPLVPERPWSGLPDGSNPLLGAKTAPAGEPFLTWLSAGEAAPAALRRAAAVVGDRPLDALAEPDEDKEAAVWRAVALRRAGRFLEARRAFRELGARPTDASLYDQALAVLHGAGPGYRWATEAAGHLAERGCWDPVWFVDACAAAHTGLLSRETAALLEQIQRAELQLLVEAGGAV